MTDEAQMFRDAVAAQRLLVQCCASCGKASLPPAPSCLHCGSPDVGQVDAATTGALRTWTVTHVAFDPAFAGEVPYIVGVVDLDDGARLSGTVDVPRERLADGLRLAVTWRRSPVDGEPVWAFTGMSAAKADERASASEPLVGGSGAQPQGDTTTS